jgi:hypothetical protein
MSSVRLHRITDQELAGREPDAAHERHIRPEVARCRGEHGGAGQPALAMFLCCSRCRFAAGVDIRTPSVSTSRSNTWVKRRPRRVFRIRKMKPRSPSSRRGLTSVRRGLTVELVVVSLPQGFLARLRRSVQQQSTATPSPSDDVQRASSSLIALRRRSAWHGPSFASKT